MNIRRPQPPHSTIPVQEANKDGGLLVPKTTYAYKPKKGIIAYYCRAIGDHIMNIGSNIKWKLGYEKGKIHPYDDLMRMMKEARINRNDK